MEEIWKPVVGYEGQYEVSNLGRVRSLGRVVEYDRMLYGKKVHAVRYQQPRMLKQTGRSNPNNYLAVSLTLSPNVCKLPLVHDLVAKAFIPNPNNLPEVNHKDGNKQNNCVDNLEWCTRSENMLHGVRTGLHRLNTPIRCLQDGKTFISHNEAARYYGCDQSTVTNHVVDKGYVPIHKPIVDLTFVEIGGAYDDQKRMQKVSQQ